MCLAGAVATWRQRQNNVVITYSLARDSAVSSHHVAASPVGAAKIGQQAFRTCPWMLETQAVGVRTDCGKPPFTPVASVLGAN